MSRTLRILLAYDGSGLVGWQRQPSGVSVQACLEGALAAIEGHPVTVVGAGRTDAGVHALGQVASCRLDHGLPAARLAAALNAMLPDDIRVLEVEDVHPSFHARYDARLKRYRYCVLNAGVASPFVRRFVWHVPHPLDLAAMAEGARHLEGERDFAALQGAGGSTKTTVRTITEARARESTAAEIVGVGLSPEGPAGGSRLVVFEFCGNGFLRHMVRNAVGTLLQIGLGRREPEWMAEVLGSRDRAQAGPTAPACGLCLVGVEYGPPLLAPPERSL